ncbi:Tyrosine-protein kinase transmembrane receptor Ror2 [Orchesella cincta]|uniref:receptor protein-tyrosine kinase n=1 Tax=Orchesella cincta TaxID=48709 RepID=A0A1D2NGL7_ORCCI|nr:Tyrosine-protein kinase transmembrane receptor Ror2 [Orchesella cincta]
MMRSVTITFIAALVFSTTEFGNAETEDNLVDNGKKSRSLQFHQIQRVVDGEKAILNCSARLGPEHRIVWSAKPNREIVPDDRLEILPDGPWFSMHSCVVFKYTTNSSVPWGSRFDAECVAKGDPLPSVRWMLDGKLVGNEAEHIVQTVVDEKPPPDHKGDFIPKAMSSLRITNATASTKIACEASNDVVTGSEFATKEFNLRVTNIPSRDQDDDLKFREPPSGSCAYYNGKICSAHIHHQQYSRQCWGVVNEQITQGLWNEIIAGLSEPCRTPAEKILCTYAFPKCVLKSNWDPVPLPLCYEDCIAVRQAFCYREWALIEDNNQRGINFKARGHFRLPECDSLPRINDTSSPCSHAKLTEMLPEEITYDCVKGRGRYYQGTVNITKTGIPCQRWDTMVPHSHNRPPPVFPEIQNAENFCRNAGGEEPRPWCYTTDPYIRWQHCDIPFCENETTTNEYQEVEEFSESPVTRFDIPTLMQSQEFIIFVGIAVIVLISLIVMCAACVASTKKKPRRPPGYDRAATQEVEIDLDKLGSNASYHRHGISLNPKLEKLEYPRNDIIYIRDLGQGAFGRVFQAKVPGLRKGEEFTMVAVKMLKEEASDDLQADFEREACLLVEFDHPNIVRLLGVCAIGKPMCLLLEYMGSGDLNEFLRSCSPSNYRTINTLSSNGDVWRDTRLSHREMLGIARQVSSGMVYLSDRSFVHRDLATRNCLIDETMVVKIADFGLSQKIYLQDYYKGHEDDAIPIRWMPLESILFNKYTIESDVWAFGICLWEIFSFALQPYYGMTHEEVVKYIKDGNVLQPPDNCPVRVYELMKMCFRGQPSDRPSFRSIYQIIDDIINDMDRIQAASSTRSSSQQLWPNTH